MDIKIKVKFFEDDFIEAIGAGVYGIYILQKDSKEKLLYVGESVFVLVRCATHLYEIVKGNGYLGFQQKMFESNSITLTFKLLLSESDKKKRKAQEIEFIKNLDPAMQSKIKDRVKPIEDMVNKMTDLLNE